MLNFEVKHHRDKYCMIPYWHMTDSELSIAAKGLMTWFFIPEVNWNRTDAEILEKTNITKEELSSLLNELQEHGYIECITDKKTKQPVYSIFEKPKARGVKAPKVNINEADLKTVNELELEGVKKTKLNFYDKCYAEIINFTEDIDLQTILTEYLTLRLNPVPGSNLSEKRLSGVAQWKGLLKKLSEMKGNKTAIVQQSITKGWATFVDLKTADQQSFDGVAGKDYSAEEQEEIKKLMKQWEKQGYKGEVF